VAGSSEAELVDRDRPGLRTERAGATRRIAAAVAGIAVIGVIGAATAYKIVTRPGRVLPPPDARLRALPPPSSADEPIAPPSPVPAPSPSQPPPAAAAAATKAAKGTKVTKATGRSGSRPSPAQISKTAGKPRRPSATPAGRPSAAQPQPRPAPAATAGSGESARSGGSEPSAAEIEACLESRRRQLRLCAATAAAIGESSGEGTARATLNPDGSFSNIRIPGGGSFASCAARVIGGVRCRAYQGGPIEVEHALR
jgi:hypothetical protein